MKKPHVVALLVFPGALALDVTGPAEVFAMVGRCLVDTGASYEVRLLSMRGGPIETASGIVLHTEAAAGLSDFDTLIVAGGPNIVAMTEDRSLIDWIRTAAVRARRVCSVCTGAFLLAAAGILDGKRAVTHWGCGIPFRAKYPNVKLDLEPIYIRDGLVWTSAGVTAGIDLALALVGEDLGRSAALHLAKELVVFLHRPGGQAQYSAALSAQATAASRETGQKFVDLHAWISENLDQDLSVASLAGRVNMAPRSFARAYAETMNTTPAKAVEEARLEAAKRALENGNLSVKSVARQCGFHNEERLRRSFVRRYHVAPSSYRDRFGPGSLETLGAPEPAFEGSAKLQARELI